MQWYDYIKDSTIWGVVELLARDYKVMTLLFAGPIVWAIKKYTDWTPWTTDDKIAKLISDKLGLNE